MMEHVGKAIDALKTQPALLSLLLLNAMVLALIYFAVEAARRQQHDELMLALERCIK